MPKFTTPKEVRMSIARQMSAGDDARIMIEIEDSETGILICQLEPSLVDFSKLVTGLCGLKVPVTKFASEDSLYRIAKVPEYKSVEVKGSYHAYNKEQKAQVVPILMKALEEHLVDGWEVNDLRLNAKQPSIETHRVSLVRYTAPEEN